MFLQSRSLILGSALAICGAAFLPALRAQSVGATFGETIPLGGTPSDMLLDELRHRLYLVNTNANRLDIFDTDAKRVVGSVAVGTQPIACAMSMDGATLYVTNVGSASLSVIDAGSLSLTRTVSLPARPEGVEVGGDGRVLITTQGSGAGNAQNTLLIYDSTQQTSQQVIPVTFPPPAPTPTQLPQIFVGRPTTTFRGKLIRTPDGNFIIGLTTFNNNSSTYLFVYEAASGTILNSRSVGGQSTVLAMAPDGSRFMAGFTLYDVATLAVIGQQSTVNAPFPISGSFNTLQNVGGSTFSPDGTTLYSAFNTAPFSQPATRPQASTLFISDSRNLGIKLGIKIPESIVAKMVITSDAADAWGLSESGLIHLPLSTLYDYPILQPETTAVFLAYDECNKGVSRARVRINNLGNGTLTFNVPNTGAALVAEVSSGVAPSTITFTMEPGRAGVNRQPGTNLYTGAAGNSGTPVGVDLVSREAINIPNRIRVYMNYRQPDQRGVIVPIPTVPNNNGEGLWDVLLDEPRGRLYITNSGYNRVEVFDLNKQRFVTPIDVGQLPHQMAMSLDGSELYVANSGGESISIVDLDLGKVVDNVQFPPIPRAGNAGPIFPRSIAMSLSGLQVVMSNGFLWKVIGNQAVPRQPSAAIGIDAQGRQQAVGSPQQLLSTPGGEYTVMLAGQPGGPNGMAFLYDALNDVWTTSRVLFTNPILSYYGPLGAAAGGSYFLTNGLILNSALTIIGGAERPGAITVSAPAAPNQPPVTTVVSAGQRNIAAVAAIDETTFVRMTTPVRNNVNVTQTRDDIRPTVELIDLRSGSESLVGVAPENPVFSVFGTQRLNIPPRQMLVDSQGNAYAITLSGLSIIALTATGGSARPAITSGSRGIVNSNDGTPNFHPGSFITVNGNNLAAPATAEQIPLPTLLGGSCVVFNDIPLPLLQTSKNQISAQIPDNVRPGTNVVQVRSLSTAQSSDPVVVTVQKAQ